jgi:hypothetical protein
LKSGITVRNERNSPSIVILRQSAYDEKHREPAVNVFFSDPKRGVQEKINLSREITDYLETLDTEHIEQFIRYSIDISFNKRQVK